MNESGRLDNVHAAIFFTRKTSLQTWNELGILDRELAIYRRMISAGARVSLVTYGTSADRHITRQLAEFTVLFNRWGLPRRWYEHLLPRLHRERLRTATVIKTNQANGAEIALRASQAVGVPLVARCGYMWSTTEARNHGEDSKRHRRARQIEDRVFPRATKVVVTTDEMAVDLRQRYGADGDKVRTIPNYVDTTQFKPQQVPKRFDVIYVGRLSAEKNVDALLNAATTANLKTLVVGAGENQLQWQANYPSVNVTWQPRVPHADLPTLLNQARLFVLPSLYEGHPKALLEAMSCGCAVVGTDVPGIRDLLQHQRNGWLCGTSAASLGTAMQRLVENPSLRQNLGDNARQFILDRFSIDRIAEMELNLYREVQGSAQNTRRKAA